LKKSYLFILLIISSVLFACFEDQDDNFTPASISDINEFIWRGLNYFYLYKADTPELANDAFSSESAFNDFLDSYATPELLFDHLVAPPDRFSIIVDDYIELENALAGITLSNGMEYGLVYYPDNSANVFGYVRYVLPNSDASAKGLERGVIFNTIDGQQLDENNFGSLLSSDSYSIGIATFDGSTVNPTGESIQLTKSEYQENPIYDTQTFMINGQKIGYLMYNAFTNEYDEELNNVFGQFKSEGITDLVVDLRYNGGGSVRTATYLASMITGQNNGQVFYAEQWNEDRQMEYAEDGLFVNSFAGGGPSINSLNLNRVYVLTSTRTASASELVINGLNPYIDVVQIGTNTTGKFQASFLLYDAPAPNFSRSQANPNHRYAMLPLVFKTANAIGYTDYNEGLIPDIELIEDYSNLGIIGDPTEPLLATAIAEITGLPAPIKRSVEHLKLLSDSKSMQLGYQIMYIDK
jgi:Peptidase family S41/Peptidase S41 N-terminal domain